MGTKGHDPEASAWPWSALGLTETSDREAIHAAYAARKAALDAQVMRVSAFAELSEAREKALFLAAELRRAMERGEAEEPPPPVIAPTPPPVPAPPPPSPLAQVEVDPPSPEAQPEPEPEPEPEPVRVSVPVTKPDEPEEEPDEAWEHAGGYKPNVDIREEGLIEGALASQVGGASHSHEGETPTLDDEFYELLEKLQLKKYWPYYVFPIFFLFAMCSGDDEDEQSRYVNPEPYGEYPAEPTTTSNAAPAPVAVDATLANTMVTALFGSGLDYESLYRTNRPLTAQLVERLDPQDEAFEGPRAQLRIRILDARAAANREEALAIGELYLAWLQTAQSQEEGGCREVTSELFFDGIPAMREDWLAFEQGLAAKLVRDGAFARQPAVRSRGLNSNVLPTWALEQAQAATGLETPVFLDALEEISHPARCRVEIAVLEALFSRREAITPAMIAAL